jgi:hypothetical protein
MQAGRRFELHACLGRGGFGEVYRATMTSGGGLSQRVAVKLLHADLGTDAVQRLRDEGRLLATLDHPAILRVLDLVILDDRVALVTELIEGRDLSQCGVMPVRPALDAIASVASALDEAWSMRLVHRDVKPANIRLSRHGAVKLLDFGIARSDMVDREARTGTHAVLGSLRYMPPEAFERAVPSDKGDVFALGATLYEVVTGRPVFEDVAPMDVLRRAADAMGFAALIDEALGRVEVSALRDLLADCLGHDPDGRPSAADVALRCEDLALSQPRPSLRRWCLAQAWEEEAEPAPLVGQSLDESTLDTFDLTPAPVPTAPAPPAVETLMFELDAPLPPWIELPAGAFAMREDREVVLTRAYAIASQPLRWHEWADLVGRTPGGPPEEGVTGLSWGDAVRVCNAMSVRDGLDPAYAFGEYALREPVGLAEMGRALYDLVPFKQVGAILEHFGRDTLHVLQMEPERLTEVAGVGSRRVERIRQLFNPDRWYSRVVTWDRDAAGYRLPTEAEWVHAGVGGPLGEWVWDFDESQQRTHKRPDPLPAGSFTDPEGAPDGLGHIVRRGRVREVHATHWRGLDITVRVARSLETS